MKITTFDPIIVSPSADAVVRLFEELGFEQKHMPTNELKYGTVTTHRMKNADGFHVEVVTPVTDAHRDHVVIRMNVDDFEEAYGILTAHGLRNVHGDETIDVKTARAATMEAPSGFRISIVKHIK